MKVLVILRGNSRPESRASFPPTHVTHELSFEMHSFTNIQNFIYSSLWITTVSGGIPATRKNN